MATRRALGTVTHSQANSRRDSTEPRRVTKKTGSRKSSVGRPSVGGASSQYGDAKMMASGRLSASGSVSRQSMGPTSSRHSTAGSTAGRKSDAVGRASLGRASIGSMSRRSSIHSAVIAATDTRPLSDPAFRSGVIRQLIQHLTENGYSHPISSKILTSPSDKDFFRIFHFLYHRIDPNFKFASTSESRKSMAGRRDSMKATETNVEQIPALLKLLKYPVKINRSTVISCGSKSNWPKNLGALHFLLELNTLKDTVDINSQIFGCGLGDGGFEEGQQTKARHNQLMFQYNAEAYHAFLEGNDDLKAEYDEEMQGSFQDEIDRISESLASIRGQTEQCHHDIAVMEDDGSPVAKLTQVKKMSLADRERFQTLIGKLESHVHKMSNKLDDATRNLAKLSEEHTELTAESFRLREIHAKQELTPEDVMRMKTARRKLDDQMQALKTQKDAMHQRAWKSEVHLHKIREETEKVVDDFNATARQLSTMQAVRKSGIDLQIRMHVGAEPDQPLFSTDLPGQHLPALRSLLDTVNNEVHSAEVLKLGHEETYAKVSEAIADRQSHNEELQRKIDAINLRYKQRKAEYDSAHRDTMSSIESMQEDIVSMHGHLHAQEAELSRQRESAQRELESVQSQFRAERESVSAIVTQMAETVVTHKQRIQECVAEYQSAVAQAQAP